MGEAGGEGIPFDPGGKPIGTSTPRRTRDKIQGVPQEVVKGLDQWPGVTQGPPDPRRVHWKDPSTSARSLTDSGEKTDPGPGDPEDHRPLPEDQQAKPTAKLKTIPPAEHARYVIPARRAVRERKQPDRLGFTTPTDMENAYRGHTPGQKPA